MILEAGTKLGHYQIVAPLGTGGMGIVYCAEDRRLGRQVALKTLPAEFTQSVERVRRFEQEARAVSALNHPHIVTIHDIGEAEGCRFIVMELIKGRTLRELSGTPLSPETLVGLGRQIAKALIATHAADITHRDIKPENVMVRDDGYVKVLDFGIARLSPTTPGLDAMTLFGTKPGGLIGTLAYMSPEQACGDQITQASDIFSLGVVFYELLTAHHPFEAPSERARLDAIISQNPLSPSRLNLQIPAALEALILEMLSKEPEQRPSAAEVDAKLGELGTAMDRGTGSSASLPQASTVAAGSAAPPLVGRGKERTELQQSLSTVAAGGGMMVCVSGEPGIGKTTLVENFLSELSASVPCNVARGSCSERLAGTEAYLPLLEALDSLLQGEANPSPARVMKLVAPTWYAQHIPLSTDDADSARLHADAKAASQERIKRELGNFLQEMSRAQPLVLVINDLHWADLSTVDILSYLASRFDSLRLLIITTFRPSDLLLAKHPFLTVKRELESHGRCREIRLDFLSPADIDLYLAIEFPGHQFPPHLATVIHSRTEGNPLFMADLLRYLRDRQVIAPINRRWALVQSLDEIADELPASVRSMVERKVDQLGDEDRQLLTAASVQGYEFDSAAIAKVTGRDSAEVEERLQELERLHHFVRLIKEGEFPNGALTLRYRFVHALYQNALNSLLRPTRRAQLNTQMAETLHTFYEGKEDAVASELAALWEAARDYRRAAEQYLRAAQNAARLVAHTEAAALAQRGLNAIEKLPASPERAQLESDLQLRLGLSLAGERGWAAPEVEQAFSRAHDLCEQTKDPKLFTALRGRCLHHLLRADLHVVQKLGEQLLALTSNLNDNLSAQSANSLLGMALWAMGKPAAAQQHFERALTLYQPEQHRIALSMSNEDLGVLSRRLSSICLWDAGYPDRALAGAYESVALAHELAHPFSQGGAHYAAAHLHLFRREWQACQEHAEAVIKLAEEYELGDNLTYATIARDAALAYQGKTAEGIADMRQSIESYRAAGANLMMTCYLGLVADLYGMEWQIAEGLRAVDEALAMADRTGERWWEAELHRTKGKLLIKQAIASNASLPSLDTQSPLGVIDPAKVGETEACFLRAVETARQQAAKSLELRAATSLGRLWMLVGKKAEARQLLTETYNWFTEGFDTPDVLDAKALIEELS